MLSDGEIGMLLIRYFHSCTKMEPFLGGKEGGGGGEGSQVRDYVPKVFNFAQLGVEWGKSVAS